MDPEEEEEEERKRCPYCNGTAISPYELDILWGYQEMDSQIEAARDERRTIQFGCGLEIIKECPCGCGLKNDICPERAAAVKRINDEIPF